MKKIFKALIAFVIIAVLAVGAYFIFRKHDGTKAIFNNVYNLTYEFKSDNENVVENVNKVVDNMLSIISNNSLDVGETKNDLECYVFLRDNYSFIKTEILENGSFLSNNNEVNDKINIANKKISDIKTIYFDGYSYLKNTYYKIVDTNYNVQTMKDYIINFNNIFKGILNVYNEFFYNTCVSYSHCFNGTMLKNNAYKLKLEYVGYLINEYYLNDDETKNLILPEINNAIKNVKNLTAQNYYNNKTIYDELIAKSLTLDVGKIGLNDATGEIENYITQLPTEADRILARNYLENVVRG